MFSDPNTIVAALPVPVGATVADLGAGTGAFSFLLAEKVGPNGKVYACDVQKDILVRLENDARDRGIKNIQTVFSNVEIHQGTKLRDASIDWVIVANVLYQIEDRPAFVKEIARIVKPGGAVLIVDWTESFGSLGPQPAMIVTQADAEKLFDSVGLHPTPLVINAGAHHYGVVFRR
jgi:ubiquinone/menaquinone biosynthesis C-methylase UbiE